MALLRSQLYKLARQGLSRGVVVALLGLALVRGAVWPPDPELPWSGLWSFSLVAAALIVLTSVTVGQELAGGTFRSLVSRGVPRWQLLVSHFVALALAGGLLLAGTEGLATLLGVRPRLNWGDLGRAWLALWPYVALVTLLAVLARNGGLALVVGIMQLALEQFHGMFMGPLALMPEMIPDAFRALTHLGLSGTLYQWSLSYNSANWTYLAEWRRAPAMANVLMYVMPSPAARSALILAVYTAGALALAIYVLYRRDVTEVVATRARLWGLVPHGRAAPGPVARGRRQARAHRPPALTGRGPLPVRLARAHLYAIGRTSLVRVGVIVALLFALVLWGLSRLSVASGFEDMLFAPAGGGGSPLIFVVTLLVVGPLAAVIGIQAVSNGLALGTRRGELARGVSRAAAIAGQSAALVAVLAGLLVVMLAATLLACLSVAGTWYLLPAGLALAAGILAAAAYVAAVQLGGALTRSASGAMLFGLGFLVADWAGLMMLTASGNPDLLVSLSRCSVTVSAMSVAMGRSTQVSIFGWQMLAPGWAALLLVGYALVGHGLAIAIARRRDA
ncbi:MAG: ABC transporter permease subunit [Anaerolineae bacterium]|jgi:ABC-type transport system involved in multi-copper enzyme maturation permease subunit